MDGFIPQFDTRRCAAGNEDPISVRSRTKEWYKPGALADWHTTGMQRVAMETETDLERALSNPSDADIACMRRLDGDILVLGASGKMGPSLVRLCRRAADEAGLPRRIVAVSRNPVPESGVVPCEIRQRSRCARSRHGKQSFCSQNRPLALTKRRRWQGNTKSHSVGAPSTGMRSTSFFFGVGAPEAASGAVRSRRGHSVRLFHEQLTRLRAHRSAGWKKCRGWANRQRRLCRCARSLRLQDQPSANRSSV